MSLTIEVSVVGKRAEAADICSFELADPSGRLLPPFTAGSHIDVHLENGFVRQYSLANSPAERHRYVIAVLRTRDSRGGSLMLHDQVNVGDVLNISKPKNHFALATTAQRSILLAGGIGITPLLAMAETLTTAGADFTLHYCARSAERAAFFERIRQSAYASNSRYYFSDSGPRLELDALLRRPDPGTHLYVCGPDRLISEAAATARSHGWSAAQIHHEYFAPAADTTGGNGFEVQVASSGALYTVPSGRSILQVLRDHGIDIASSCEQGVCGTCVTRVLAGVPDHRDSYLMEDERARNDQILLCCSRAKTPRLVLDL